MDMFTQPGESSSNMIYLREKDEMRYITMLSGLSNFKEAPKPMKG